MRSKKFHDKSEKKMLSLNSFVVNDTNHLLEEECSDTAIPCFSSENQSILSVTTWGEICPMATAKEATQWDNIDQWSLA